MGRYVSDVQVGLMWLKSVVVDHEPSVVLQVSEWSRRGFPCVLLHGLGDGGYVWSHLAARLMARFRVLAVDLRGHGDSDWDPKRRYDSQTLASDLCHIEAKLDCGGMVLVGHSLGADVAIRFAAANASLVAALIIVDFGPELDKGAVDGILDALVSAPRSFGSPADYADWLRARRPLADATSLRQFARQSLRESSPGNWELKSDPAMAHHSQLVRYRESNGRYVDPELWGLLEQIKPPTLLVRGAASGVFPADVAHRMVERTLRDGRLATVGAAGHAVLMDNPVEFSACVSNFLSRIGK